MSTSGLGDRNSALTQTSGNHDREHDQADHAGREPPPRRRLADRQEEADQPEREQDRARPVDGSGRPDRRLGNHDDRRDRGQDDEGERDPEQPVVVEVLEDRAGKDDPEPASDPEQPGDERDTARHALTWELVADDAERQREDGATEPLDHAGDDHHGERRREACEARSRGKTDEHDEQHPLLAEHVPEPPGDRRRDRRREQIGGEDPRDAGRRRVEILLQRRQRRHDQGLEHGVRASADGEHCEHEAGTRSRPGGDLRSHPANLPAARALPVREDDRATRQACNPQHRPALAARTHGRRPRDSQLALNSAVHDARSDNEKGPVTDRTPTIRHR